MDVIRSVFGNRGRKEELAARNSNSQPVTKGDRSVMEELDKAQSFLFPGGGGCGLEEKRNGSRETLFLLNSM